MLPHLMHWRDTYVDLYVEFCSIVVLCVPFSQLTLLSPLQQTGSTEGTLLLTAMDFERAMLSVNPAYTHSEVHLSTAHI